MSFYKEQLPKREKKCETPTSTLKLAVHLTSLRVVQNEED